MHEDEKYYALMALVCRKLPHYAVQMTLDEGHFSDQQRQFLHDVKRGRLVNLAALSTIVRCALPKFEIPAHLLPETAEQQVAAA